MQKNGAGVHTAHSCYWDTVTDGVVTVMKLTELETKLFKSMPLSVVLLL